MFIIPLPTKVIHRLILAKSVRGGSSGYPARSPAHTFCGALHNLALQQRQEELMSDGHQRRLQIVDRAVAAELGRVRDGGDQRLAGVDRNLKTRLAAARHAAAAREGGGA